MDGRGPGAFSFPSCQAQGSGEDHAVAHRGQEITTPPVQKQKSTIGHRVQNSSSSSSSSSSPDLESVQEKDCQLATEHNPRCPDGLPKLCCVNVMPTSCMSYKNILSLPDANPCVSAFCCVASFWFRHCMPWTFIYSFIMAPTFNPRVPNKGKLWQVLKRPASVKNKYPNAASFVRADRHK